MVVAVVVVGWSSCGGLVGVLAVVMVGWCLGGVLAVFSLFSLCAPLSPWQLFFCFDSFKSNYRVWVSSFWMAKNSDAACSYWRV